MFCREVKLSMSSYLDGLLDSEKTWQLEEHVASCPTCRDRLGLMQEIPVALQTDRMLAPRPEFTKLVMQRIIVRQQVGDQVYEMRSESVSLRTTRATTSFETPKQEITPDDDSEDDTASAKVVSLAEARAKRVKSAPEYLLRFSSIAAVLVVLVGAGIYLTAGVSGEGFDAPTAAVYGAIKGFADTVRSGLNSPLELLVGIALAVLVLIGLWYMLKPIRRDQEHETGASVRRRA